MKFLPESFTSQDADIFEQIAKFVKDGCLEKDDAIILISKCSCVEAQRLAHHIYNQDMDIRFVREIFIWVDSLK
jgi:hypothetical protein